MDMFKESGYYIATNTVKNKNYLVLVSGVNPLLKIEDVFDLNNNRIVSTDCLRGGGIIYTKQSYKIDNTKLNSNELKDIVINGLVKRGITSNTNKYIVKGLRMSYEAIDHTFNSDIYYDNFGDLYFCKDPLVTKDSDPSNPYDCNFISIGCVLSMIFDDIFYESNYKYSDFINMLWLITDYLTENYIFIHDKIFIDGELRSK